MANIIEFGFWTENMCCEKNLLIFLVEYFQNLDKNRVEEK